VVGNDYFSTAGTSPCLRAVRTALSGILVIVYGGRLGQYPSRLNEPVAAGSAKPYAVFDRGLLRLLAADAKANTNYPILGQINPRDRRRQQKHPRSVSRARCRAGRASQREGRACNMVSYQKSGQRVRTGCHRPRLRPAVAALATLCGFDSAVSGGQPDILSLPWRACPIRRTDHARPPLSHQAHRRRRGPVKAAMLPPVSDANTSGR
jgi:hypothetical protein